MSVNVTELCVFGIPGSETGKTFALVKTSPGHWEMKGSIELLAEVHGVDCVVKSDEDEDVGYINFEVSRPARSQRQKVETSEANLKLEMSWEVIEIPSETDPKVPIDAEIAMHLYGHGIA
ncbi:hypothetical protein D9611_013404 [Ephemerocybe angulata]|uniref:Uncharacterized protein n=1 Tax=Ephemerocybe angulata TaxID=980116 RepID=A0A8H5FAT8_9AGAR|nr:hypothetical protein D9611_013404 [Tulosesus angulatus]